MKILYAEDDEMMQKVVVYALAEQGYELTTVDHGLEAREYIDKEAYDLIILDLFMPKASGFEVVEYIREEKGIDTPILIISRNNLGKAIEKAYTTGANDYISKPFEITDLINKVKDLLQKN